MIKQYLEKIINKNDLTLEESYRLMQMIMKGEVNNSHLAGLLIALKVKGESSDEIAGFAKAMREASIKIKTNIQNTIDVCGTGGDNSGTFNISTAAAFVVAGTGVHVAKHGNRSVSSKCGSADVLQELGINISLPSDLSEKALNNVGITFLFAPEYHPAMKYAMPVRKELGIKTIFNMLGPLTNPAGVKKQLIGTFDKNAAMKMCYAASNLDYERVCFICSDDSLDEISLNGLTDVFEYDQISGTRSYTISNDTFGYPLITAESIKGDSSTSNAEVILSVLKEKKKNNAYYIIAANAAMALYTSKFSDNLNECKLAAEDSIKSGKAYNKLCELRDFKG